MKYIIGSDEVGYGAWAGPLVVCAAAVPVDWTGPAGLADSKEFSSPAEKAARIALYAELQDIPVSIMAAENTTIDKLGVKNALVAAHTAALHALLQVYPDAEVIVDGIVPIPGIPRARCVAHADGVCPLHRRSYAPIKAALAAQNQMKLFEGT
jgi:ribonuclease HII